MSDQAPSVKTSIKKPFSFQSALLISLLFSLNGAFFVAIVEFRSYKNKFLRLKAMDTNIFDASLVFWSLIAKTLVLLLPLLIVVTLFLAIKKNKLSFTVLFTGALILFSWIIADLRLMRITGAHISNYFENILDPVTWQWGSDLSRIYWQVGWDLFTAVLVTIGLFLFYYFTVKFIRNRSERYSQKKYILSTASVIAFLIIGIFPAMQFVGNPLVLERLYASMPTNALFFHPENVPRGGRSAFSINCDEEYKDLGQLLYESSKEALPIDKDVIIPEENRPNVILFIVESFRNNAVTPETMPKLSKWIKQGTFLKRHYANANKSELGTFALMYSRSPVTYDATTDANIESQLCDTFKRSDYKRYLVASCDFLYAKMDHFMNEKSFDVIIQNVHKTKEPGWWKNDIKTIQDLTKIVAQEEKKPKLIVSYLMSTHYRYFYPPEYEIHKSDMTDYVENEHGSARNSIRRDDLLARYNNSLAFMDDQLGDFLSKVDLTKNIVIITGDHGESFYEDGYVTHGSMLSEIQTNVPMLIAGPGIPAKEITVPTSHVDLLPTLVNLLHDQPVTIKNCHGQDIFSPDYHPMSLVIHEYVESYDLLFMHPEGRLKMNLRRDRPALRLTGFANEKGRIKLKLTHSPTEIPHWHQLIAKEIETTHNAETLLKIAEKHQTNQIH